MASYVFNENSSFIHTFKHQISDLVVTISDPIQAKSMENLLIDIYSKIFALLTNLKCLDLDLDADDIYHFRRSLLWNLRSTTCFSSNIVHLRIKMHNFDDCLRLLNGRLSQLHTFIITLDFIYDTWHGTNRHSLKKINNLNTLFKLTCFSLCVYFSTHEFESLVVPLLRRMSNLEKLTLSISVRERNSFIDGTYLHKYVLSQMPHLHTFTFDIVTVIVRNNQQYKPSSDDIQRTFIEKGYHVDCYVDYDDITLDRCHVYSLPFNMKHIHDITHSFPGATVTENFTRNTTRMNCAKLKHIDFYHKRGIVPSKNFCLYFPLLYHDNCK
ncbi:unnamed protein product [Rotaria sordida]|uniref:Uncharacterized protein n=1 Tax=Rotaria sordida TaxID=392033 RepID=A0A815RXA1_9BILA|nr:unnamed protein product [Rotaria sordida]